MYKQLCWCIIHCMILSIQDAFSQHQVDYYEGYNPVWTTVLNFENPNSDETYELIYQSSLIHDHALYVLYHYKASVHSRYFGHLLCKFDIHTGKQLWCHFYDRRKSIKYFHHVWEMYFDSINHLHLIGLRQTGRERMFIPQCQLFEIVYDTDNGNPIDTIYPSPRDTTSDVFCGWHIYKSNNNFITIRLVFYDTNTYYMFFSKINKYGKVLVDTIIRRSIQRPYIAIYNYGVKKLNDNTFLLEGLKVGRTSKTEWFVLKIDDQLDIVDSINLSEAFSLDTFAYIEGMTYLDDDYMVFDVQNGPFSFRDGIYLFYDISGILKHVFERQQLKMGIPKIARISKDSYLLIGGYMGSPSTLDNPKYTTFATLKIGGEFNVIRHIKIQQSRHYIFPNDVFILPNNDILLIGGLCSLQYDSRANFYSCEIKEYSIIRFSGADFGLTHTQQPDHNPSANALLYHFTVHYKEQALSIRFDNPFSGYIHISSAQGRVLHTTHLHQSTSHTLNLQSLPPGIYFLSGHSHNGRILPTKSFAFW